MNFFIIGKNVDIYFSTDINCKYYYNNTSFKKSSIIIERYDIIEQLNEIICSIDGSQYTRIDYIQEKFFVFSPIKCVVTI